MGFLKGKESKRCLGENQVKFAISREKTRSMSQIKFLMKNAQLNNKLELISRGFFGLVSLKNRLYFLKLNKLV